MPLDPEKLEQPLDKLRKLLNKLPKQPSADQVHDIRTRTRGTEAVLHALQLDGQRKGRRVLKAVTPVRKRAGKVRDMDVLIGFASTLSSEREKECIVELLEHLGHHRFREARKLHKTVVGRRRLATASLKRCSSAIQRNFNGTKGKSDWPAATAATALRLTGELASWPRLNATNLHEFRLKVKELRYVLQLSGETGEFAEMLGEVKDKIGEWHDWAELASIAEDVLQHSGRREVVQQIRATVKRRFDEAMRAANHLRHQYIDAARPQDKGRRDAKRVKIHAVEAAARLAA